jgi:hypothetical protein
VGLDQLEATATPDEIRENPDVLGTRSEDQTNTWYDNLSDCPDDKTYLIAWASRIDETLTSETAECVRREIDEDVARRTIIATFTSTENMSLNNTVATAAQPYLGPLQLMPESGPPGTTIELSGEPCPPPDGWSNGGVASGMYDEDGRVTIPDVDIPLNPDGSWQGQIVIPDSTAAGVYTMRAHCSGAPPDGQPEQFHVYRNAAFEVTDS